MDHGFTRFSRERPIERLDEIGLTKKCTIVLWLLEEAQGRPDDELKEEISQELEAILSRIPWAREVEKITISRHTREMQ